MTLSELQKDSDVALVGMQAHDWDKRFILTVEEYSIIASILNRAIVLKGDLPTSLGNHSDAKLILQPGSQGLYRIMPISAPEILALAFTNKLTPSKKEEA